MKFDVTKFDTCSLSTLIFITEKKKRKKKKRKLSVIKSDVNDNLKR